MIGFRLTVEEGMAARVGRPARVRVPAPGTGHVRTAGRYVLFHRRGAAKVIPPR